MAYISFKFKPTMLIEIAVCETSKVDFFKSPLISLIPHHWEKHGISSKNKMNINKVISWQWGTFQ